MAWTTPKTWSSEPLTSDDLNTYNRDNMNYLKSRVDNVADGYATSGGYSTTSTSWVDVDATNLNLTVTVVAGDVMVTFRGNGNQSNGNIVGIGVLVDGTTFYTISYQQADGTDKLSFNGTIVIWGLSAGSHTFKLQWVQTGGGTTTMDAGAIFDARELMGVAS